MHKLARSLRATIMFGGLLLGADIPTFAQSQEIEALQGFPLRRLNYMFNQYVVPTIFKEEEGLFVQSKFIGEGRPVDDGRHWLGMRTVQGYRKASGWNQSLVVDFYKSYDYGRDPRFDTNVAMGYGYTTKDYGFHAGIFSQVILGKPSAPGSANLPAGGPGASFDEADGIGASLDWFAYYKFKNIAKIRAIFKTKGRQDGLGAQNEQKKGFEVIGGSFKDLFNLDYYRAEKQFLFDAKLNDQVKALLGEERFSGDGLLSRLDLNVRYGYSFADSKTSEWALGGKLTGKKWTYGIDLYRTKFNTGNIGGMFMYNLVEESDLMDGMALRVVGFVNYTPLVLESHSKSALFIEFRYAL